MGYHKKDTDNRKKNSTEHLDPWKWKPGQSGNPKGRPKLTGAQKLEKRLQANDGAELDEVINGLIMSAKMGDLRAIAMVLDRHDGKVVDQVNVTTTQKSEIEEMSDDELRQRISEISKRRREATGSN